MARPAPGEWVPVGHPAYLRQQVELSLRRLRVARIDLLHLHRVDPLVPFAAGEHARSGSPLDEVAKRLKATPGQVALAWLLRRSPVLVPIPGRSLAHLAENLAAVDLDLPDAELAVLNELAHG